MGNTLGFQSPSRETLENALIFARLAESNTLSDLDSAKLAHDIAKENLQIVLAALRSYDLSIKATATATATAAKRPIAEVLSSVSQGNIYFHQSIDCQRATYHHILSQELTRRNSKERPKTRLRTA